MTTHDRVGLRIALEHVKTRAQIETLRRMFETPDVEHNLDLHHSPLQRPGMFAAKFDVGDYYGHLWRRIDTDEIVGMFLMHATRLKSAGIIEADAAVPDLKHRGHHFAREATVALFDYWILGDRCQKMWAWVDEENPATIKMLSALHVPIVKRGVSRTSAAGLPKTTVEFALDKPGWLAIRKELPYALAGDSSP